MIRLLFVLLLLPSLCLGEVLPFTGKGSGSGEGSSGSVVWNGTCTPAQLSGDVDNYAPSCFSSASALRVDGGGSNRNITGLDGGADGRVIVLHNIGSNNLVLKDASGSSDTENRFIFDADYTVSGDSSVSLRYDGTSGGWRFFGKAGGGTACTDNASGQCVLAATRSSSDSDFTAANIKNGTNILNVTGTYAPVDAATSVDSALSGSSYTVAIVADVSTNTEGAWTEVVAATASASMGFVMSPGNYTGSYGSCLLDIGTGAASSETALINDILLQWDGGASTGAGQNGESTFYPFSIPTSTRVVARVRCSQSAVTVSINLQTVAGTSLNSFTSSVTYGADTSDSGGLVVDPGASANTDGSWTEVTASTSANIQYLMIFFGGRVNAAGVSATFHFDIATGGAGSETVKVDNILVRCMGTALDFRPLAFVIPINISAGTRIAVRSRSTITDATDRLIDITLSGLN